MSNLPIKINNENIFIKIKNFFKNLFKNRKKQCYQEEIQNNNKINEVDHYRNDFTRQLQFDTEKEKKREELLEYLDEHHDTIYTLSNEKIEGLIKIYKEEIKKLDMRIAEMKHS